MRMSPVVNGVARSWHVEKVAGANIVYTCPPPYIEGLLEKGNHLEFSNQIEEPVPKEVMDKLMKIPYFKRGYAEDGYKPEEFNTHPALGCDGDRVLRSHPVDGRLRGQSVLLTIVAEKFCFPCLSA